MSSKKTGNFVSLLLILGIVAGVFYVFFLGLSLGIISGLSYGWVINPVECADCTPSQLSTSYKEDYVTLVVDSYSENRDIEFAQHRLETIPEPEVLQLLAKHYELALEQNKPERSEIIRELMLIYHDPELPE